MCGYENPPRELTFEYLIQRKHRLEVTPCEMLGQKFHVGVAPLLPLQ